MEVDRILYIFGSFSRKKRERRKSLEPSSISAGNSPLKTAKNSRPTSQSISIAPRTCAYGERRRARVKDWECGICRRELVEPRLLSCLHSFCTRCLQGLHQDGEAAAWEDGDAASLQHDPGGSASRGGSAGSGYESDFRKSGSDASLDKLKLYGIITRKVSGKNYHFILCPTCGSETQLPLGGIAALPLNYVLLRRMANRDSGNAILCDLCCTDNKAASRCGACLVSVCAACGEAHTRQRGHATHLLQPLEPVLRFCAQHPKLELTVYCATCQQAASRCGACLVSVCAACGEAHTRQRGHATHLLQPLEPVLRFCAQHPKLELTVYCATCQQVICRDCCLIAHSGHAVANASRAANERTTALRDACERTKHVPDNVERANRILELHASDVEAQAARIESEIRVWSEEYRQAVEAHGRALCSAAVRARAAYRQRVEDKTRQLAERAAHAVEAVKFAEELIKEGKEDEVLSLSGPVLRRLERLTELQPLSEPPRCELRFAPAAPATHRPTLVGRLFTLAPDPNHCVLETDGLQDLQVEVQHTAILELRDSCGERIWCGGENVAGYFRRRDSSARPAVAKVRERGDGTYALHFTPHSPGHFLLAVTVNNTPIKGSPFSCAARMSKAHTGQFHCCAFCSSGGKKNATCGCGSSMGGGYKGCGHGHKGWPGARHWSCCGSTQRHSTCTRPSHQLYQFSL